MAAIMAINGARLNKNLSEPLGVSPSFTNNFTVSANDCNKPFGPTRLGPRRICIQADTLRSMITNTKPNPANKPIAATPMITPSINKAMVGSNCALSQLSIWVAMSEKEITSWLVVYG